MVPHRSNRAIAGWFFTEAIKLYYVALWLVLHRGNRAIAGWFFTEAIEL